MSLDPALTTLAVTSVVGPVVTWALTRRRNAAAVVKDEADAAESLSAALARLGGQIDGLYARLSASESRASAAESRLAAAEARAAIAEAEVARLRGEVAGLQVRVEQQAATEKRLVDQISALEAAPS